MLVNEVAALARSGPPWKHFSLILWRTSRIGVNLLRTFNRRHHHYGYAIILSDRNGILFQMIVWRFTRVRYFGG